MIPTFGGSRLATADGNNKKKIGSLEIVDCNNLLTVASSSSPYSVKGSF
jgi:hypothetical protein